MKRSPLLLALLLGSCGGAEAAPPPPPPATASASAVVVAPPPRRTLPTRVDDVLAGVPKDASFVVHLPAATGPGSLVTASGLLPALELLVGELPKSGAVGPDKARALLRAFDGGAVFGRGSLQGREPEVGVVLRFTAAGPFEELLAALGFQRDGELWKRGEDQVAWLPEAKVAVAAPKRSVVEGSLDALAGVAPSFRASALAQRRGARDLWVAVDLAAAAPDEETRAAGSRVFGGVGATAAFEVDWAQYGKGIPRLGAVLAPTSHALVGVLPKEAVTALGVTLGRRPGKSLADLADEVGRALSMSSLSKEIDRELRSGGASLADLDKVLGSELALGFYADKGTVAGGAKQAEHVAAVGAVDSKDDALAGKLLASMGKDLQRLRKGVTLTATKLTATLPGGEVVIVELQKGRVAFGFGGKKPVERALSALARAPSGGKDALGSSPAFVEARKALAPTSHLVLWSDASALAAFVGQPPSVPSAGFLELSLPASDDPTGPKGLELVLRSPSASAGASTLGMLGALAAHGVRRYLAAAKTAEAKNYVGAVSRAAVAAFEREERDLKGRLSHKLCESAAPVPAAVPKGTRYDADEKDFATAGWRCLKFMAVASMRYRLEYRKGGGYKGPKRGGPDPGKDGFEVSAEGDLDGNGKTSLFTRIGKPNKKGEIELSDLFVADELE